MAKSSVGRRVVHTVYHAALEYYAVRVLFSCIPTTCGDPPQTIHQPPAWLDASLNSLIGIVYKSLAENQELMYRYAWPLYIALRTSTDPIHREWLHEQVGRVGVLLRNMSMHDSVFDELKSTCGGGMDR